MAQRETLWLVPLTHDQLLIVQEALGAYLYERAPENMRSSGNALDPSDDPDNEDENESLYGESYADTYKAVTELETLINDFANAEDK